MHGTDQQYKIIIVQIDTRNINIYDLELSVKFDAKVQSAALHRMHTISRHRIHCCDDQLQQLHHIPFVRIVQQIKCIFNL